jgi:branched-chain amino acid transport system substrate-binding protein
MNFATAAAPDITASAWSQNSFRLCPIFPPDGPIITTYSGGNVTTQFLNNDSVAELTASDVGSIGLSWYHYTLPQTDANAWLVQQHQAQYGEPPDLDAECGFATAQAIVAGLEATDGDTSPAQLIPALEGMQFDGPKGTYTIRPADHQVLAPLYVVQLTSVDDPDQAYFELVEEIPGSDDQLPCTAPNCS